MDESDDEDCKSITFEEYANCLIVISELFTMGELTEDKLPGAN